MNNSVDTFIEKNNLSDDYLFGYAAGMSEMLTEFEEFVTEYKRCLTVLGEKIKERQAK